MNHSGCAGASLLPTGPQPIMTGPGVFCYQTSALQRENLISALLVIIIFYYTRTPPGGAAAIPPSLPLPQPRAKTEFYKVVLFSLPACRKVSFLGQDT